MGAFPGGALPEEKVPEQVETAPPVIWEMVRFAEDSSELDGAARQMLRMFAQRARAVGQVQDIHVAVWADEELPPGRGVHLATSDEMLARERGESIERFLEDALGFEYVHVMNMAVPGNWLSRIFPTESELIRKARGAKEGEAILQRAFLPMVEYGGVGKAVFVATFRQKVPYMGDPYYFGVSPWHY
jgi:hypothetical protein